MSKTEQKNRTRKKILIIEDEPDQILMLRIRLEGNDFEVVSAPDGDEGLKTVQKENPDLIILDLIMPKMDGLDVCRNLKGNTKTSKTPIIVMTASGEDSLEEKSRSSGSDCFMRKPYDSKDLVEKIKELLDH